MRHLFLQRQLKAHLYTLICFFFYFRMASKFIQSFNTFLNNRYVASAAFGLLGTGIYVSSQDGQRIPRITNSFREGKILPPFTHGENEVDIRIGYRRIGSHPIKKISTIVLILYAQSLCFPHNIGCLPDTS